MAYRDWRITTWPEYVYLRSVISSYGWQEDCVRWGLLKSRRRQRHVRVWRRKWA